MNSWPGTRQRFVFTFFTAFVTPRVRYSLFSDESYSIYLFHHILAVALGILVIEAGIGGLTGLIVLSLAVGLVSIAIHRYLISRSRVLRFEFNGK